MNDVKGWIFVSHSTKDLEPVRRIRDYLEAKSHHPLLFFLKCIRDTDELDSLITREIEARTIFLLCDSPNARSAQWVQRGASARLAVATKF
jgi:TIR domain-containing protein